MKSNHLVGRKGLLCLSSLILVSSLGVQADSSPEREPVPTGSFEVRMREAGCSTETHLSPILAEVRAVLPELNAQANIEAAREALERAYGERVNQVSAPVYYTWIKINGQWVWECHEGAVFEVDFGTGGTVLVAARNEMPTPLP